MERFFHTFSECVKNIFHFSCLLKLPNFKKIKKFLPFFFSCTRNLRAARPREVFHRQRERPHEVVARGHVVVPPAPVSLSRADNPTSLSRSRYATRRLESRIYFPLGTNTHTHTREKEKRERERKIRVPSKKKTETAPGLGKKNLFKSKSPKRFPRDPPRRRASPRETPNVRTL